MNTVKITIEGIVPDDFCDNFLKITAEKYADIKNIKYENKKEHIYIPPMNKNSADYSKEAEENYIANMLAKEKIFKIITFETDENISEDVLLPIIKNIFDETYRIYDFKSSDVVRDKDKHICIDMCNNDKVFCSRSLILQDFDIKYRPADKVYDKYTKQEMTIKEIVSFGKKQYLCFWMECKAPFEKYTEIYNENDLYCEYR